MKQLQERQKQRGKKRKEEEENYAKGEERMGMKD